MSISVQDEELNKIFIDKLFEVSQNSSEYKSDFEKFTDEPSLKRELDPRNINPSRSILNYYTDISKFSNKCFSNLLENYLNKSNWLADKYKNQVREFIETELKKNTDKFELLKLLLILLSIPYAELEQDKKGFYINYIYEHVMKFKEVLFKKGIPSSGTPWQIPHTRTLEILEDKNLIKKHYEEINNKNQVPFIAQIIMNIGIDNDLDYIFSAYNHSRKDSSQIAAIQIFINFLKKIAVDLFESLKENKPDIEKIKKDFSNFIYDIHTPNNKNEIDADLWINDAERERLVLVYNQLFSKILEQDKVDLEHLENILNNWKEIEVDGAPGPGTINNLELCLNFFGYKIKELNMLKLLERKDIPSFFRKNFEEKIVKIVPTANREAKMIDHANMLQSLVNQEYKSETELLDKLCERLISEEKYRTKIKNFSKTVLKKEIKHLCEKKHSGVIITFLRRNLMSNPMDVNSYVHNCVQAFWYLLD